MPHKKGDLDYVSLRLVPKLHKTLREIVTEWQNKDRKWNKSRLINPIIKRGLKNWNKLSDGEIAELFDEYDDMVAKEVK